MTQTNTGDDRYNKYLLILSTLFLLTLVLLVLGLNRTNLENKTNLCEQYANAHNVLMVKSGNLTKVYLNDSGNWTTLKEIQLSCKGD